MPLPDIDLSAIRQHRGGQANAFEELCCQLANDEPITDRVKFDRKGAGGDGGVECFATLADGSEVGWQVKFYSNFDSMIGSLDKSLDQALDKHPKMSRFIACFPFDLADSRREDVKTALSKWGAWRSARVEAQKRLGRTIAIERWDAHEIKQRLTESNARSAGRIAFWFDKEMLTAEWLEAAFRRTKADLGNRYSPKSHINLPIRQTILAAIRDPSVFDTLERLASRIRDDIASLPSTSNIVAVQAAVGAASELERLASEKPEPFPASSLADTVDKALGLVLDWYQLLQRHVSPTVPPSPESTAVSNLAGALRRASRTAKSPVLGHLDTRSLLVLGEAGTGKSHLLADSCARQLAAGRPSLMVLGGKLPDGEPWGEIMRNLDLPKDLQVKQFLGAVNAAGEAAGVRALIAIDALNEKNGQAIWLTRLTGLISDVEAFPWITLVLSCRSTYEGLVIPDELDEARLPRLEHEGFEDEDVIRYLAKRGISVPETPRQLEELRVPLFVRLACDALAAEGEVLLPESLGGITDAFALFSTAVAKRVHASLNSSPNRKLTAAAVDALANEMALTGQAQIGFAKADAIVRAVYNGQDVAHDLLFQLENEGLLAVENDPYSAPGSEQIVRFTFERLGDHAVTASLLSRASVGRTPAALSEVGSPLHDFLSLPNSTIDLGVREALAIQLPEKFGIELPDLADVPPPPWHSDAFEKSLLNRRASAFGDRTLELIDDVCDPGFRYETLIALATEPNHPFNVLLLDAELRAMTMPERDRAWSVHLANSDRADHLVDWVWAADQTRIAADRAELAATQLAWFLTATRRPLRDRATKALVFLLADRPDLALTIWSKFKDLDDGYVSERVAAALFGAAMQGRWPADKLSAGAVRLHGDLFATGAPPTNALLRDHAFGLIEYALSHAGPIASINPASLAGPFSSPWPIDHVPEAEMDTFVRTYSGSGTWGDEIKQSCLDGDFGRYVLDYAIQGFSAATIGTTPLPTPHDLRMQWFERFQKTATQPMLQAHDDLLRAMVKDNPDGGHVHGEARERIKAAKSAFLAAVGPDAYEEWREQAEHWRAEGMYQSWARKGTAEFNLAWARRWVVKRAHDLGWSEALHGDFDRAIRTDRNEHSLERIGKKYQWLALYELVARMKDNVAHLEDLDPDELRLRNLDPSLLVAKTSDDGWREFEGKAFWTGEPPELPARTPQEAIAWLHSDDDVLDGPDTIEVTSPDGGRRWLVLTGFETWRLPVDRMRTEAWRRVACLVVKKEDLGATLALMSDIHHTTDTDVPSAEGGGYHVHLGEYPWRSLDDGHDEWIADWGPYDAFAKKKKRVNVLPTTAEYMAETGGYDGSVVETINLHLPARWIMRDLGLKLTDGRSIRYADASDVTRFMDPSVSAAGRSAALVDRDAFLKSLAAKGLVAVWTVAGEKNAYGDERGDGFGGRFTFTRIYHSDGGGIVADARHDTRDAPDKQQLTAFLGLSRPAASIDKNDDEV